MLKASSSPTPTRTTSAPSPGSGPGCARRLLPRPSPPPSCGASCASTAWPTRCRSRASSRARRSRSARSTCELITSPTRSPSPTPCHPHAASARVLHTGDWKLDPEPLVGERTTTRSSSSLGDEGVLAMVCDSTNVLVARHLGLRGRGAREPDRADRGPAQGRVAAHLLRLERRAHGDRHAARRHAAGRRVCLVGRSMLRMSRRRARCGLMEDLPPLRRRARGRQLAAARSSTSAPAARARPRARPCRGSPTARTRMSSSSPAICDLLLQDHPGQREHAPQPAQPARPPGVEVITERDHSSTSRATRRGTSWSRCTAGSGRGSPSRSTARPRHLQAHQRLAEGLGVPKS